MKGENMLRAGVVLPLLLGGVGALRLKIRPSRTSCRQCGKEIPPGRAGRRCEACRGPVRVEGLSVPEGQP